MASELDLSALIACFERAWAVLPSDSHEERTVEALIAALKAARDEGAE